MTAEDQGAGPAAAGHLGVLAAAGAAGGGWPAGPLDVADTSERPTPAGAGLGGTGAAAAGPGRLPWYRRRSWLWAVAVVLIVAVAVVLDLPGRNTPALRRTDLANFISGLDTQVGQCDAGLHDALSAYRDAVLPRPKLPMSTAAGYTADGIAACSFTNSGIVALGSQQAPRTLLPFGVGSIPAQLGLWADYQAFTTLQDLKVVIAEHGAPAAIAIFDTRVAALDAQRSRVEDQIVRAEHRMGAKPSLLPLTDVSPLPVPAGGGRT